MFANKFGQYTSVQCGLVNVVKRTEDEIFNEEPEKVTPIPLVSVIIRATLVSVVAKVELVQVYVNQEEQPIEAIYYFPVDSNGGVTYFHAELEGRTIEGIIKPQKEAEAQYEKAVLQNQTAFLLESNKPDIFKVRIGFLKPGAQVKISIGYTTEVKTEKSCNNAIRFFIPTTVAPRYIPKGEVAEETTNEIKNMEFSSKSPAPLSITVNIAIQGKLKSIESPSHKIEIQEMESQKKNWTRAIVQLLGKTTDMDRDFVLLISSEDAHSPRLYREKVGNSEVLMAHLIPSFSLYDEKMELIFVLDRSGSMQGESIDLAKQALILFLHSLPVDCYFNVVGFGSTYQFLFPKSVKYDDNTLKKAVQHCRTLDADLGGTEIFEPLSKIFSQILVPDYLRQIFVLTDGEVENTDQVIGLCKGNSDKARVFSLGLGASASHYLVEGIASAGGGTAEFVNYGESIEAKVLHQLKNAAQPSLNNVSLTWRGVSESDSSKTWKQAPENIPNVFDGSQLIVFGLFDDKSEVPTGIKITADSPDDPLSVEIELTEDNDGGSNAVLHKLAAIKLVQELEMKIIFMEQYGNQDLGGPPLETLKKELINIACQNGLVSKYTSYVAVDTTPGSAAGETTENWIMQSRYIPSQLNSAHFQMAGIRFCGLPDDNLMIGTTKCRSKSLSVCPSPGLFGCAGGNRTDFLSRKRSAVKLCSSHEIEPISMEECDFEEYRPAVAPFSAKPKASLKSAPKDFLQAIVMTQSFNGSFPLNEDFAEVVGKSLDILKSEASKGKWDSQGWATAIALAFFEEKLKDLKESWELVAIKARAWLEKNQEGNLDAIVLAASTFLRTA